MIFLSVFIFFSLEHFDVFLLPQIVCEKDYDVGFWMKISNKWFLILFSLLYKFRCILVIKPHIYQSHGPVVILWSCWPWFCLLRFLNYFSIIFFLSLFNKKQASSFFHALIQALQSCRFYQVAHWKLLQEVMENLIQWATVINNSKRVGCSIDWLYRQMVITSKAW